MATSDGPLSAHRFSDIADEPNVIMAAVRGFNDAPHCTLEQAIEPVKHLMPGIADDIYVAILRARNPADGLSVDESAAIALYSMERTPYTKSLYYILNKSLRTEDRNVLVPWFRYLKLFLTALSRCRTCKSTVYRGVQLSRADQLKQYTPGETFPWWGFSSCSVKQSIAEREQFLGSGPLKVLFKIDCTGAVSIEKHSRYENEREVLLRPGTMFKVTKYKLDKHGVHHVYLAEIKPPITLLEPVTPSPRPETHPSLRRQSSHSIAFEGPERRTNAQLRQYIAQHQTGTPVTLTGKNYTDDDMEAFVQYFINGKNSQILFFRSNDMTTRAVRILSQSLHNDHILQSLYIAENDISDDGIRALAQTLAESTNRTLRTLSLSSCNVSDKGAEYLADMLARNRTLTQLNLPKNRITDRGLQLLLQPLIRTNRTLQRISLEWNKFGHDDTVQALTMLLQVNPSLTELNVTSCSWPRAAASQLKAVAKDRPGFKLSI